MENDPKIEDLYHYEGQVLNGFLHGKGTLSNSKGIAEGTFVTGRLEGEATITMVNGNKYLIKIKDGVLIEKTILKEPLINPRKSPFRNPKRDPFNPGPKPNSPPKGTRFLGLDFGENIK